MDTIKDFFQHTDTHKVYVLEKSPDGDILGVCGPILPGRSADEYFCTQELLPWAQENKDKLIQIELPF